VHQYRDYQQQRKEEVVDGKPVVEWEVELSVHIRKTADRAKFEMYVQKSNKLDARLAPFSNQQIFRELML